MICVVFDFDGPILDSRIVAKKALDEIWGEFFPNMSTPDLCNIPLLNTNKLINTIFARENLLVDNDKKNKVIDAYSIKLKQLEKNTIIDINVRKTLELLKNNTSIITAIISNRKVDNLISILNRLGIRKYFDYLYGRDSFSAKPSIEAAKDLIDKTGIESQNMIYIGDQDIDYYFSIKAGMHYYHAGYSSEPCDISWKKAEFVFSSTKQLMDAFLSFDLKYLPNNSKQSRALKEMNKSECCFFVGAGISVPSGVGDWTESYKRIFDKMNLTHLFCKENLAETIQLLSSDSDYSKQLFDAFKEYFSSRNKIEPNFYHYLLLNTKIKRIWTTNYDNLFEQLIINNHMDIVVIKEDVDVNQNKKKKLLIKMNGDFENARYSQKVDWGLVFSQEQFDLFEYQRPEIKQLFMNDFTTYTFIFIGISFDDPILKRMIRFLKHALPHGLTKRHYYLTVSTFDIRESELQRLKEKELERYGISTLYFNSFDEIRECLQQLYLDSDAIKVGVSGSIPMPIIGDNYYSNSLFTADETASICNRIGNLLATEGFCVYSGGAPFVGIPAVEGAFDVCPENAMFFFRKGGGSFYKCNAQAKISKTKDISDMRNEFIKSIDFLIVIAGRITEKDIGIIEEIQLAFERKTPIIMFKQFGGQSYEYFDEFIEQIPKHYNEKLREQILAVNIKVNKLDKKDTEKYMFNELLDDIKELLLVAASTQIIM